MEAIDTLSQLSDFLPLMFSLLADGDVAETQIDELKDELTFLDVVVLGDTGAGKSAVLNSLIGHPVLPTGEGGATHAPSYVHLRRDGSLSSGTIIEQGSNLHSSRRIQRSIKQIWRRSDKKTWNLITSTAPPLKLIDLPGIENGILDDSLNQYIKCTNAILLVVIPADQAPSVLSAKAIKFAKEVDKECTRTVGVITKIDKASSEANVLVAVKQLLLNNGPGSISDIPWVAMIESVTLDGHNAPASLETESTWLAEHNILISILEGAPESKLGRFALVETIAQQIQHRMKVGLPNLFYRYMGPSRCGLSVIVREETDAINHRTEHTIYKKSKPRSILDLAIHHDVESGTREKIKTEFKNNPYVYVRDAEEDEFAAKKDGFLSRRLKVFKIWAIALVILVLLAAGFCLCMGYERVISTHFLFTGAAAFCWSLLQNLYSTGMVFKDLCEIKSTFWKKSTNKTKKKKKKRT